MTARADLTNAVRLSAALDQVTAALALVSNPQLVQTLVLSTPDHAGVSITLNISTSTLTTMLTNRQTTIQAALTALGVTS